MNTFNRNDDSNEYLWNRSGAVDPVVAELEEALGPLAFRPSEHPLSIPVRPRRRWPTITAVAASVVAVLAAGLFYWRLQWPAGRAWPLELSAHAGRVQPGTLAVGETLRLDGSSTASVAVARLGTMEVQGVSDVTLTSTESTRHRLRLDRGGVRVRIWAPPSRVAFTTPAGDVIDLGCIFTLTVDGGGAAHVVVETGWVQLENGHGEVLVPAGASTSMTAGRPPLVPVYEDATNAFREGVRAIEDGPGDRFAPAWRDIRRDARPRDVLTLLVLALRLPVDQRATLLEYAAILAPPPRPIAGDVRSLDDTAVWEWFDSLPLPPAKSWWRNWPDAFRK